MPLAFGADAALLWEMVEHIVGCLTSLGPDPESLEHPIFVTPPFPNAPKGWHHHLVGSPCSAPFNFYLYLWWLRTLNRIDFSSDPWPPLCKSMTLGTLFALSVKWKQ